MISVMLACLTVIPLTQDGSFIAYVTNEAWIGRLPDGLPPEAEHERAHATKTGLGALLVLPFSFGGQMLIMAASSTFLALIGLVLLTVGSAIGQILTAPFTAGVVVLLYTDRRIRAEALDLVLQTGAAFGPGAPADSTDHLWLTRQS